MQTLYKSNADKQIRYACQAHEEYEFQMQHRQEQFEELQAENNRLRLENEKLKTMLQ